MPNPTAAAAVCLALLAPTASTAAQDRDSPIRVQPDALDFGTLRVGAHVEANFMVLWGGPDRDAKRRVAIEAPPFVRVVRDETGDSSRRGVETRVWIAIATAESGALSGTIELRRGELRAEIPVRAVVLEPSPLSTRVLVADTPFDGDSTEDGALFDAWRRIVATGRLEAHYLNPPARNRPALGVELLQRVDVVLLGETTLARLTAKDAGLLHGFVCGGGRVVVAANFFFRGTVTGANRVLEPFGLRMDDAEPDMGQPFEFAEDDIVEHALTDGVRAVRVARPSPTNIVDPERAQALVRSADDPDVAFAALARTESGGEIVSLGASLWWNWANADPGNSRLLRNLLTRERDR